ncbi:hypothetical protein KAH43_02425, partial [Candidatus Bipolaricaulota bacterium]|nr:hypothetical protein [Candidatus Bipolaricaulota bacterium]
MPQENSDWKIRIGKVLELEHATGYEDRATTCGLEAFVRLQHPASTLWVAGYGAASPTDRQSMAAKLGQALTMDGGRDPQPAPPQAVDDAPNLGEPITKAQGIGAKRAALLAKLGLKTIEDLLMFFPHRLEDRTQITAISKLKDGMDVSVQGMVHVIQKTRMNRG